MEYETQEVEEEPEYSSAGAWRQSSTTDELEMPRSRQVPHQGTPKMVRLCQAWKSKENKREPDVADHDQIDSPIPDLGCHICGL